MTHLPSAGPLTIAECEGKGRGLVTTAPITAGATVVVLTGRVGCDADTNDESLQIGPDRFLESTKGLDDYINHSCDANCAIEWSSMEVMAQRTIHAGEEVTIDYNTAEYDLTALLKDHSFPCNCRAVGCVGWIRGFHHLTRAEKLARRHTLSPFLRGILAEELEGTQPATPPPYESAYGG